MQTDRYQRHSLIDWFSQDDVKSSKFAIIGCGAVGNEVAKNLALLGVGHLDLFDFDKIEIHNLTRSVLFRETDVGRNKAEVAAARIRELDPNIEVNFYPGDFWISLSLSKAKLYDSIICCVDNFEARVRLNQLCLITQTNLINTGIDSKFSQVEVFPFKYSRQIACYECNLPASAYQKIQQRYSCGWLKRISFIERKIPTTIITSSLTGAIATSNALNLIREQPSGASRRIFMDSFTANASISQVERSASCPACSSFNGNVTIVKGKAEITNNFSLMKHCNDEYFTTSEPILVSYRCIHCQPDPKDETLVFKNASDFDATLTTCKQCGEDAVEVTIKDRFSFSEVCQKLIGLTFPCKYLRLDSGDQTTIIELE